MKNTIELAVEDIEKAFNENMLADSIEFESRLVPLIDNATTASSSTTSTTNTANWEYVNRPYRYITVSTTETKPIGTSWVLESTNKRKRKPIKEAFSEREKTYETYIDIFIYIGNITDVARDMYMYCGELKIEIYKYNMLYNKLLEIAPHLIIKECL